LYPLHRPRGRLVNEFVDFLKNALAENPLIDADLIGAETGD